MGLTSPGSCLACLTSCFLCLPRNGPGPGHGALSPLSREVLLPESPQHLWQGAWGELRKAAPWGPCFCPGLPAPPGGGRPPGPGSVPVCLQELPLPVLPVPRPPHVFPAEGQRPPHGPPEALRKVGALSCSLGACRRPRSRGRVGTGRPGWEPPHGEPIVPGEADAREHQRDGCVGRGARRAALEERAQTARGAAAGPTPALSGRHCSFAGSVCSLGRGRRRERVWVSAPPGWGGRGGRCAC